MLRNTVPDKYLVSKSLLFSFETDDSKTKKRQPHCNNKCRVDILKKKFSGLYIHP